MTAFLFIPSASGAPLARRVDFANIAGLFAEVEEPARRAEPRGLLRAVAMVLLVLLAIGDTVLVARPGSLANGANLARPSAAAPARPTAL